MTVHSVVYNASFWVTLDVSVAPTALVGLRGVTLVNLATTTGPGGSRRAR